MKPSRNVLVLLAPVPAMLLGALAARGHSVPWLAFAPNALGVIIGGLGAACAMRARPRAIEAAARVLPPLAVIAIAATFLADGLDGVHRWVSIGPVRLNLSAALTPCVFLGFLSQERFVRAGTAALIGALQLIHLAQPDAAQATALAFGALPLLASGTAITRRVGLPLSVLVVGVAAATWARNDPLAGVEHVEGILGLIASNGTAWIALAALVGAALLAPFLVSSVRSRDTAVVRVALGLGLFQCAAFAVTFFGQFPVAVFGAGAGPVLGWYSGLSVIATSWQRADCNSSHAPRPETCSSSSAAAGGT